MRAYKVQNEPWLADKHKEKRVKSANRIRTNFRKDNTMKTLFSNGKMFDIDGIDNSQNDEIWAVNRSTADRKGGIRQKCKFLQKVMAWFGICSKGVSHFSDYRRWDKGPRSIHRGSVSSCCQAS